LVELNRPFGLMRQHAGKRQQYVDMARRYIGPPSTMRLTHRAVLDSAGIRDALLMGPNARRISPSRLDTATGPLPVTVGVFVLLARKPGATESGGPVHPDHRR
jgi:hypothetical protein